MSTKIRSIILSICLLVLFVVNSTQPAIAYDNPLLEVDVTDICLTAGDENQMSVSIKNIGSRTAHDVKAALTVPSTVLGISIVDVSYAVFKNIYCGETVWMYPILYVESSCPIGAYSLMLELRYTDYTGATFIDSVQIGVAVDAVKPTEMHLSVDVEGYHVTAGAENEINITLTNVGEEAVYDVEAVLTSDSQNIVILRELSYLFDDIDVRGHVNFRPLLAVSQSILFEAYSLTLTLDYKDSNGVSYRDKETVGLFVDSIFSHTFAFKTQVGRYCITAGAENTIEITLSNVGDTAVSDVNVQLSSTTPYISVLKDALNTFNTIGSNQSVYFTPTLGLSRNTPLGAYSLTLTLKCKDQDGTSYSDSLIIGVLVDSVKPAERTKIAVQNFKVTPTEVFPGDELTVELNLKNLGDKANDVQAKLAIDSESQFVSLGSTLVFVGDLGSNETAEVVFSLRIKGDADATLYVFPLTISYYDVYDQPQSLTEAISIAVHSIVDFRLIDIQPSAITAKPGETVTIEADLLLLGTETVDFVEVEIIEDPSLGPFSAVSESYEYIGTVDPDSPVLFTIQFMVEPDATSGSYTLQIRVSCWDGYNKQRQVTIELPIEVTEFSGQNAQNVTNVTLWDTIWTIIRILLGVKP